MKREIKFRGKYKWVYHEWLYGYLSAVKGRYFITPTNWDAKGKMEYEVLIDTVGQFTGLYDRDGKEIYEGDIVQSFTNWGDFGKVGVVEFSDGRFRLNVNGILSKYKDFVDEEEWDDMGARMKVKYTYKVIGNIYENHELLNK